MASSERTERAQGRCGGATPPPLSVVVLTYNSASTIERCLDSLVTQDFNDFETIVVDDASTDETVSLVSRYSSRLRLTIVPNGSNNIPRGRNIGLSWSTSDHVAFLDSDDSATHDWARVIVATFAERPELALIGGFFIPAYRTKTSQAIGLNDATIRQFAAKGVMRFSAGNCAINRNVVPGILFDDEFPAAEDLELASRVQRQFPCSYIPEMRIYHTSRDSLSQYAKQMYRYGFMKLYFSFCARSYRSIDFLPLFLIGLSILAGVTIGPWWIVFAILPFSLIEALVVVTYHRCRPLVAILTFPAWVTKNIAWSLGVGHGIFSLAINPEARRSLAHETRRENSKCPLALSTSPLTTPLMWAVSRRSWNRWPLIDTGGTCPFGSSRRKTEIPRVRNSPIRPSSIG